MVIGDECVDDPHILHDAKRDAIGHLPLLILMSGIKFHRRSNNPGLIDTTSILGSLRRSSMVATEVDRQHNLESVLPDLGWVQL